MMGAQVEIAGHIFRRHEIDEKLRERAWIAEYRAKNNKPVDLTEDPAYLRCRTCNECLPIMLPSLAPDNREGEMAPCKYVRGPKTFSFACTSGRIALANDLREYFPGDPATSEGGYIELDSAFGILHHVGWYAKRNYLTNIAGNCSVWFLDRQVFPEYQQPFTAGIDVVIFGHSRKESEGEREEAYDRLDKKSVARIHTELWWFAIVDAADLPTGAKDTYYREITYYDLPVGQYDFTIPDPAGKKSDFEAIDDPDNPDYKMIEVIGHLRPVEKP